jgi:hypothetical protein
MTGRIKLTLLVVFLHWLVAVLHLFIAAKVLPAPNNIVSSLAITLISLGHLIVSVALWKLSPRLAGLAALIFFLAAMSADLFEHFLHPSANNVSMLAPSAWTAPFDVSVFILLALEFLGCLFAIMLLSGPISQRTQRRLAR